MCDNMEEDTDVCARRRLEFRSLPFKNKSFYVDVKSKAVYKRVEDYINSLGGSIETFLSNDIHVFVSDSRPVTKRGSRLRGESSLQHGDTSLVSSQTGRAVPLSRGKALLMKARKNTSEILTSEVNSVNNIQEKATEMGIKIEHVHNFLKRCKELGASSKQVVRKESSDDIVPIKWEDKCFLKVEDDSCQYRPLHKRLENLPLLYPDNGGGSPFDGPFVLTRPGTEGTARKEKKVSRFAQTKGGFCEMCQAWYKDTLKQHAKSSGHQKFVRNKENFAELDKIIRKLPKLNKFLFKYIPTRSVERIPCYKSDTSSPVTSPTPSTTDDVYDFKDSNVDCTQCDSANMATKQIEQLPTVSYITSPQVDDDAVTTEINTTSTLATSHDVNTAAQTSGVDHTTTSAEKNLMSCKVSCADLNHSPVPDLSLSEKMRPVPIFPHHTKEALVPESTVTDVTCKPGSPVFNLDTCDMLSGFLGADADDSKMFSDASDADSQTNVLKNLIDSLSLKNDAVTSQQPQEVVPMSVATPFAQTPAFPNSTVPDLTTTDAEPREMSDDSRMSTGSPSHVSMVTETMSPQLKLNFKMNGDHISDAIRVKSRKRKEKNKCMYMSKKTSDTKIKLCKVLVTPIAQKSNLKMFWKVRKTGDCRLLFSTEKRKRSVQDENSLWESNTMASPLRGGDTAPKSKRQRLVF